MQTRRHSSALLLLLLLLLAGMLLYPFIEHAEAGRIGFGPAIVVLFVTTRRGARHAGAELFVGVICLAAVVSRLIGRTLLRR